MEPIDHNSIGNRHIAESQRHMPENQRHMTESQRYMAENQRLMAENQRLMAENQRPADNTIISQPRRGLLPKSRTFSVLSSITNSLSRSSLIHHGSTSRNDSSRSSHPRITSPAITSSRKPTSTTSARRSTEPLLAEGDSQAENFYQEQSPPMPDNPRFVTTAMPSQYWSGRFAALHDKFHNEVLLGRNLNIVVEAQASHSGKAPGNNSAATRAAAAQNNPSASAYSVNRPVPQLAGLARYNQGLSQQPATKDPSPPHPPVSRIPQSATSGAILQTTPYSTRTREPSGSATSTRTAYYHKPFSSRPPSYEQSIAPGTVTAPVSPIFEGSTDSLPPPPPLPTLGYPGPKRSHLTGSHINKQDYTSSLSSSDHNTPIMDGSGSQEAMAAIAVNNAATLTDDDARCRRVLVHLEAMCVTETARESLRAWRIAYARKTQRAGLLPCGETLEVGRGGAERERQHLIHGLGRGREIVRKLRRSLVGAATGGLGAAERGPAAGSQRVVVRSGGGYSHAHHSSVYARHAERVLEESEGRRRGRMMMGMM